MKYTNHSAEHHTENLSQLCTYLTMAFMETRSEYVESKDYPAYELFQEVYKLAVDNYSTLIDEENGLLEYDDVVKLVYDLNLVNKN